MNKGIIFLVILMSISIASINAQITIRENDVVERPVFKPKQFDSLTNIVMQKHPTDYKKYIGYKLFFLPKSKKYKTKYSSDNNEKIIDFLFSNDTVQIEKEGKIPFEQITLTKVFGEPSELRGRTLEQYNEEKKNYENIDKEKTNIYLPYFYHDRTDKTDGKIYGKIGTSPDSIYGKYFSILNIEGKEPYGSKEFKKLDDIDLEDGRNWQLSLKITLSNEENQDVLYWIVDQARFIGSPFFLVPYFEKQREIYLNQNVVLRYSDRTNTNLQNLIDVNTGETINIKYGEVWTCSDISFIESKESYYLKCYYFLKNGDKEVKIDLESELLKGYFMLETEFKLQELEKQRKEEERKKEEEERQKKAEQQRIIFEKESIAKWGQKMGGYIADGKVLLGMNKEMCIAAWGNPINRNRTMVSGLTSEQWVYGWGTYLYFDNGKLTAIQD
jgi:hypothetical protein